MRGAHAVEGWCRSEGNVVKLTPTPLAGAFVIDLETRHDERGFFARAFSASEFEQHGLNPRVVNTNISVSSRAGTMRGMHYQAEPHAEAKLVRCTRGAIHDVIIDLRPDSATYGRWVGVDLAASSYRMLYVPEGFAHGFVTLTDDVEVTYQVSEYYAPAAERGIRYDDPAFGIDWPVEVRMISEKDRAWPSFGAAAAAAGGRAEYAGGQAMRIHPRGGLDQLSTSGE
jgi:dTDP-4-dehydrorhamnose 3,5-epimerase